MPPSAAPSPAAGARLQPQTQPSGRLAALTALFGLLGAALPASVAYLASGAEPMSALVATFFFPLGLGSILVALNALLNPQWRPEVAGVALWALAAGSFLWQLAAPGLAPLALTLAAGGAAIASVPGLMRFNRAQIR